MTIAPVSRCAGQLKKLNDLDDHDPSIIGVTDSARWFSRVFTYDSRGRVLKAKGWNPNGFEHDFPFEQFYGYDAFNHMTSRSGSYYYQPNFSDSASFSNNRRTGWTYVADGQETHSTGPGMFRDLIYNAAGNMLQVKETQTANNQFSTYVASYDGDGEVAREFLQEDVTNTGSYKVRSTVLGELVTAGFVIWLRAGKRLRPGRVTHEFRGSKTGTEMVNAQFTEDRDQLRVGQWRQKMGYSTTGPIPGYEPNHSLADFLAEKQAEINDDEAGVKVGNILEKLWNNNNFGRNDARREIFNLLCDH